MPIGKNLKKDTLIPQTKKVKAKKAVKRKKVVKKETTPVSERSIETTKEKVEQTLEVEAAVIEAPIVDIPQKKIGSGQYISEKEFSERQRLKAKFDAEIKGYKGRDIQLITFPLGKERYAVDIDAIREVVPTPNISKIPHSAAFIKGVANIRGTVMVILDLAEKFELREESVDVGNLPFSMVIKGLSFNAGILVREVPVTLKVSGDDIVSSAGLLNNTALDETYIKGLINTEEGMVIYIDVRELLEDDDVKVLSQSLERK